MERTEAQPAPRRRSMVTMVNEQLTVGRLHQRMFGRDRAGPQVGRYRILRRLGEGSMGSVYLARDPDLEREVALKLFRPRDEAHPVVDAEDRLWREAQLLARVSDPNVVAVHEVGRIEDDGTVFVAMELVRGVTLRAWLEAHPEAGWRRGVELVEAAARGLAAVHAAGVLHRDIKPTNILVGDDGRVRLVDFGLARPTDGGRDRNPPEDGPSANGVVNTDAAGTPAYMAPEQHYGAQPDARTDVYALCMVLFEAVFGQRPFGGTSPEVLPRQKVESEIEWVERRGRVPRSVRAVLARGLDPDPAARFASADELVRALSRLRRRRWVVWAAAAAMLAVGMGAGAILAGDLEARKCQEQGVARVEVWGPDARRAVSDAFGSAGTELGRREGELTVQALDAYADALTRASVRACADQVAEAPLAVYRTTCLEGRASELRTLVTELGAASGDVVAGGRDAVGELPDPATCLQPGAARLEAWTSLDDQQREQFHGMLPPLARAQALHHAGDQQGALESVDAALELARDLPAHGLVARAHFVRAQILQRMGRFAESEAAAREAILAAGHAGDPALAARAWSIMIFSIGAGQHRFDEALAHEVAARAALSQMPAPDGVAEPLLEMSLAATLAVRGDYGAAAVRLQRLADDVPDLTPHRRMLIHHNLALVSHEIGQSTNALMHADEARALAAELHGPRHPTTARMLLATINALRGLDRGAEATTRAREVVDMLTPASPDEAATRDLVLARLFLALTLLEQEAIEEASGVLERIEQEAAALELGPTIEPSVLLFRGIVACKSGEPGTGIETMQRALVALRSTGQAPPREEVDNLLAMARCDRERGELDRAADWVEAASQIDLPVRAATMTRLDLLEEQARVALGRGEDPGQVLDAMEELDRITDRATTAGLVQLFRGRAALAADDVAAATRHLDSAMELLSATDTPRARELVGEARALRAKLSAAP